MCELLSSLPGAAYLERVALSKPANIIKAKKAITKAFRTQIERQGFSMVELLSPCPTDWAMPPLEALKYLEEKMIPYYPLGVYRDWEEKVEKKKPEKAGVEK
jgi:2-oxoglutarate ferredoxin oxidoreductase subunit beta